MAVTPAREAAEAEGAACGHRCRPLPGSTRASPRGPTPAGELVEGVQADTVLPLWLSGEMVEEEHGPAPAVTLEAGAEAYPCRAPGSAVATGLSRRLLPRPKGARCVTL